MIKDIVFAKAISHDLDMKLLSLKEYRLESDRQYISDCFSLIRAANPETLQTELTGMVADALGVSVPTLYRIGMTKTDPRPQKLGFVYLIFDSGSTFFKIGFTRRDPIFRIKEMSTGNPNLSLVGFWRSQFYRELDLHEKFSAKRQCGEWFSLSNHDVDEVRRCFET